MEQSRYGNLVQNIYQGVLDGGEWQRCLAGLKELTCSETAGLLIWDKRKNAMMVSAGVGADQSLIADYERHYSQLDPAMAIVPRKRVCDWYIDAQDFGMDAIHGSEYYQDFLYKYGIGWVGAVPLMRAPEVEIGLSFQRSTSVAPYDREAISALEPFLVHLQQATHMHWRFRAVSQEAALARLTLNRLRYPLLVVDTQGEIVMSNTAGEQWLQHQNVLSRRGANLQSAWHARFVRMARTICGTLDGCARINCIRVEATERTEEAYLVGIPLPEGSDLGAGYCSPLGLVMIQTNSTEETEIGDVLLNLFSLSRAEVRVVEGLIAGLTVNEIAEQCSLSKETIRSQLKCVYSKMSLNRQSDLIKLVDGLLRAKL